MNNYKVLFGMRVIKNVITNFIDIFLVLYFLNISENNILPLGIYKLIAVFSIFAVMFFTKNFCKSKYRVNLVRIGIVFNFVYFLTIILLREHVVNYIYLVGLLFGLTEGFYYSAYSPIESDAITNEERPKFSGLHSSVKSILTIIFPLIFGTIIYTTDFTKSFITVLAFIILHLFLSFCIKDTNIPANSKTDLKEFHNTTKNVKQIREIYINRFFCGLTYSEGAFSYIVTFYIIKVFSNSFSLGIFTSIFSLISCILGLLFAKYIKSKHYSGIISISMIFTIISLCILIYDCNFVTIVLFNFFQTISKSLIDLINFNSLANISNMELIRNNYKVEYWLGSEKYLFIGRIISNTLLILMAFTGANIMIYIFVVFLVFLTISSINLQKAIK